MINGVQMKAMRPENAEWQSLLSEDMQAKALAVAEEIAESMPQPQTNDSFSVPAEIALFYGYLAKATGRTDYAECAFDYLNESISRVPENLSAPWLHGGFVGVAWSIAHLAKIALGEEEAENCAVVDELLIDRLSVTPWQGEYDAITGLAGLGVYALERLPEPSAVECLRRVLARLAETAERCEQGLTWFTTPQHLPEWQSQLCPNGYYNLGTAHGVPGVIAMLAQVCAVDEVGESARALLEGAVRWLLANRSYDKQGAYLTYWLVPGGQPELARQAWCYGELGAATALLLAARCVGNQDGQEGQDWEEAALEILRRSALRRMTDAGVKDAGVCHGAAGNAHLFNRIYQATGEDIFKQAALYWYEQTFAFKMPGEGIGGFQVWGTAKDQQGWATSAGFLEGVTGIGLALLAAATDIEPNWDRLLLASIPPRRSKANA